MAMSQECTLKSRRNLLLAVGTVTQVLLSRFSSRRVVMAGLGLFSLARIRNAR
jgi:hypothetical protein